MRTAVALTLALVIASPAVGQDGPMLSIAAKEEYGRYLVGPDERPVYAFVTEDVRGGSGITPIVACVERCLEAWPLVTIPEPDFQVAEGVDPFLAEPLEWEGNLVLVYNSRVLFHYFRDEPAGEPQGQEIHEYGGWWYLMRPDGTLIQSGIAPDPED
jgi:hypothetical protein